MKTADRENPNSRNRLCNKPSPWGGTQETPSPNQAGWKVRKFPAEGEVFFLTFPFIELRGTWQLMYAVRGFGRETALTKLRGKSAQTSVAPQAV
jgi:hypothetical protein